jgi:hypothetical protein
MKRENALHVISSIQGGWSVSKTNGKKALKRFPGKMDAIAYARKLSTAQGMKLYIHNSDGTVARTFEPPTETRMRALEARIKVLEAELAAVDSDCPQCHRSKKSCRCGQF